MSKAIYLSVIIPAWNESANIQNGKLNEVVGYLSKQDFASEIIVVNDGSSDDTLLLLQQFCIGRENIKIIDNPHLGKAASVIAGERAACGQIILFTDMDQATPMAEFSKFVPFFQSGSRIVIGSRAGRKGAPLFRQVLAYGMVAMRTLILRLPYRDTQCGFKAFTAETARRIFNVMAEVHEWRPVSGGAVNPGFDVELLYLGRKFRCKTAEVAVIWNYQNSHRVGFVKDAIAGLKELLQVRIRALRGVYHVPYPMPNAQVPSAPSPNGQ
jgi:dolichyl-phosphate beta-glucosyltransferase